MDVVEWGGALDGGSCGTIDPMPIDKKAGLNRNFSLEARGVELAGEYTWHGDG